MSFFSSIFGRGREPEKGPIKWVETDKFVMADIPAELQIDPRILTILHSVSFLELSGDNTVDPDWSIEALEHMAYYLQRLDESEIMRLRRDTATIASWAEAQHIDPRFVNLVRRFTQDLGLEPDED